MNQTNIATNHGEKTQKIALETEGCTWGINIGHNYNLLTDVYAVFVPVPISLEVENTSQTKEFLS